MSSILYIQQKSLFNLNDDEELTHGGLALDDSNLNNKLDMSDDDDDDMLDGKIVQLVIQIYFVYQTIVGNLDFVCDHKGSRKCI